MKHRITYDDRGGISGGVVWLFGILTLLIMAGIGVGIVIVLQDIQTTLRLMELECL